MRTNMLVANKSWMGYIIQSITLMTSGEFCLRMLYSNMAGDGEAELKCACATDQAATEEKRALRKKSSSISFGQVEIRAGTKCSKEGREEGG